MNLSSGQKARRFVKYDPERHEGWQISQDAMELCNEWALVEVPKYIEKNGTITVNPDYENAPFEIGFLASTTVK